MNYCSLCGVKVERRVPEGDNRPRDCCPDCGTIFYVNPKVVVGCIVEHAGRVLLCRRAIEPRRGFWTCPAGFLELGESVEAGAVRETWEEAMARVEILGLHSHFDVPHIGQCYVVFRARLQGEDFGAGEESLETALFEFEDIPWEQTAFPVLRHSLQRWVEDRKAGRVRVHTGVVQWQPGQPKYEIDSYRLIDDRAVTVVDPGGGQPG